ncbi:hypothetical protein [Labedaea rhizosphaerae]|uniref:Uncharacterized protein n=1 Tax=Labedaea rhizosphaerae TaxID=598644 RepID=A0A4R6S6T0_LABRH|nr:hypothetical protein [Labedaea rhizosphaerae]TDP95034.1 hypothetical protein EV186_105266 [Labedaea rhizosphaerae]
MVNAQQGFRVEHEALQLAANRLPQQSSALTKIRGAVTAHQVAGTSFGKVSGSPSAASAHDTTIRQLAQNLDRHAKRIDELTRGVSSSDADVKSFDEQKADQQKVQGAAIPGAEIIHNTDGHDSFLITPTNKNWSPFTLPNTAGNHQGFNVDTPPGFFDASHTYSVDTPTKIPWDTGRDAVQQALIENPVPNSDHHAATPDGATNDALGWAPSKVSSYVVPSQDPGKYTDMVVNYTQPDHTLSPGFVLRRGALAPDGTITIESWGEGRAWQQSWPIEWMTGALSNSVWDANQRDIANIAMQRLGMPH